MELKTWWGFIKDCERWSDPVSVPSLHSKELWGMASADDPYVGLSCTCTWQESSGCLLYLFNMVFYFLRICKHSLLKTTYIQLFCDYIQMANAVHLSRFLSQWNSVKTWTRRCNILFKSGIRRSLGYANGNPSIQKLVGETVKLPISNITWQYNCYISTFVFTGPICWHHKSKFLQLAPLSI